MLACYSYIGRAGSVLAQHQLLRDSELWFLAVRTLVNRPSHSLDLGRVVVIADVPPPHFLVRSLFRRAGCPFLISREQP